MHKRQLVTSSASAVTFSMMSSRLLKWCVLQPSARSTNSCVACFLTDRSRSSAIWPSWGITTTSISSSWSQRAQRFKNAMKTRISWTQRDQCMVEDWLHKAVGLCWERRTGCAEPWSWSQYGSRSWQTEREMLFLGICLNREWTSVELLYSLNWYCFVFDEFYYINTVIFLFYYCEADLKQSVK